MFIKIGKSKFMKIVLYITTFAFVGTGLVALILYKLMGGISGIAEVNGKSIPVAEVLFRAAQMKLQLENQGINVDDKKLHKEIIITALNQAINDELIHQEAEKEGIEATKQEAAVFIKNIDIFKKDGKFSKELYLDFLNQFNISPQLFEEMMRKQLSVQHILTIHNLGFYITKPEIDTLITNKQAKIYGRLIVIKPKNIVVSENEIKEYYEDNKKAFAKDIIKKITVYKIDIKELGEDKAKKLAKELFTALKQNKTLNNPAIKKVYEGDIKKVSGLPDNVIKDLIGIGDEKNIVFSKDKDAFYITKYEGLDFVIAPYEEVKEAVKAKLIEEKSMKWVKRNFDKIKKDFEKKSLDELAKEYNAEIVKLEGQGLPKLTSDYALMPEETDLFLTQDKGIIPARDKIIAFEVEKRLLESAEANMVVRMFTSMIKEAKKQAILNMYIQHLRDNADIKINKELLERL